MKKNILMIFLTTTVLCYFTCSVWANPIEVIETIQDNITTPNKTNELNLHSDAAILIDATTGEILYEKNINKKEYPASITKVMTALLAFESNKMEETITFSHNAIFNIEPGSSHIALQESEQITMRQAMYALLLRSANEAALGIAEQVDGSVEKFAEHMTQRAKELGCKNTNFINPNGLHDENHYTTAYDMALIAKEALKFKEFKEIIQTTYYEIPPTNKQQETRYLYGQHQMIKPPSIYVYEGCEGGKTGFTNEAQNTLVTYAKRNDTELIVVVFQCKGAQHYEDTIKLFDYGFSQYKTIELSSFDSISQTVPVLENETEIDSIIAKPSETIYQTVSTDFNVSKMTKTVNIPESLTAPIYKNDIVGTVTFYYDKKPITTVELLADHTVSLENNTVLASTQNDKKIGNKNSSYSYYFNIAIKIIVFAIVCSIIAFLITFMTCRFISWRKRKKRHLARIKRKRRLRQK